MGFHGGWSTLRCAPHPHPPVLLCYAEHTLTRRACQLLEAGQDDARLPKMQLRAVSHRDNESNYLYLSKIGEEQMVRYHLYASRLRLGLDAMLERVPR